MSSNFLTLEGPPGPAGGPTGGGVGLGAPPRKYGVDPAYAQALWSARQTYSATNWPRRYTHFGERIVSAHPEGGCLDVVPNRHQPWMNATVYNPESGVLCWPAKYPYMDRSHLLIREPERGEGLSPLFSQNIEAPGLVTSLYEPEKWKQFQAKKEWEIYIDKKYREAKEKGLDPDLQMEMISQGYDPNNAEDLAGFWGDMKRRFTPPRAVRKFFRRAFQPSRKMKRFYKKTWRDTTHFVKKGVRYTGAATVGVFMTARQRNKTFGLRGAETGQFEISGKVVRGVLAAVAVVATGGTILALKAQAAGAATAGGAATGTAAAAEAALVPLGPGFVPMGPGFVPYGPGLTMTSAPVSTGFLAKIGAVSSWVKSKAIVIGKFGGKVLAVKSVADRLMFKEIPAGMVPGSEEIPEDGFIYDPSLDPMYEGGFMGGFPQYPAGQEAALLPWGDEETPESDFESDAPLKDAIAATVKGKPEIKPIALAGVAMLLFAVSRRT